MGVALFLIFAFLLPIFGYASSHCEIELTVPVKGTNSARVEWMYRFTWNATDHTQVDYAARQMLAQSEVEVARWIELIVENYLGIAKGAAGPPARAILGGKRVLDRWLFWLQNFDEKFAVLSAKIGPEKAFRAILKTQVQTFKSQCPPDEIFRVIEGFQKVVSDWQRAQTGGPQLSLVVGGSFINGKIRRGSDIDIYLSDGQVLRDLQPKLIAVAAASNNPLCRPVVEPHGEGEFFYGRLNPFVVKISEKGYELFVFKPRADQSAGVFPPLSDFKSYNW